MEISRTNVLIRTMVDKDGNMITQNHVQFAKMVKSFVQFKVRRCDALAKQISAKTRYVAKEL